MKNSKTGEAGRIWLGSSFSLPLWHGNSWSAEVMTIGKGKPPRGPNQLAKWIVEPIDKRISARNYPGPASFNY
ncbi:MAG TPA: hypothetical protein VMU26_13635 [Candidatus Polarisedimenticolia bacterium]|nr:hypothetical protein [Candidatus Polarisedimenticolia bacterium]